METIEERARKLVQYHQEQVDEAISCNEFDQARLHDYLLGIARQLEAHLEKGNA